MRRFIVTCLLLVLVTFSPACTSLTARNPAFPVTHAEAKHRLRVMRTDPAAVDRPVIYVGPFLDPGLAQWLFLHELRRYLEPDAQIVGLSFPPFLSLDDCRRRTVDLVQQHFPSDDPTQTVEVDVIGFSMGGLVARYAALPPDADAGHPRQLRIHRLFTIATPHNGAQLAPLGGLVSAAARKMRHGSAFMNTLNAALPDAEYQLIPYVRLGDFTVGPAWAAPPGRTPYWASNRPLQFPHIMSFLDARIRADIITRLRGELPLTAATPAPLPE